MGVETTDDTIEQAYLLSDLPKIETLLQSLGIRHDQSLMQGVSISYITHLLYFYEQDPETNFQAGRECSRLIMVYSKLHGYTFYE